MTWPMRVRKGGHGSKETKDREGNQKPTRGRVALVGYSRCLRGTAAPSQVRPQPRPRILGSRGCRIRRLQDISDGTLPTQESAVPLCFIAVSGTGIAFGVTRRGPFRLRYGPVDPGPGDRAAATGFPGPLRLCLRLLLRPLRRLGDAVAVPTMVPHPRLLPLPRSSGAMVPPLKYCNARRPIGLPCSRERHQGGR